MKVKMKDVAESAGVSVATVSRVLAGAGGVGAAKRQAVRQACRRLGYRPDARAASLRTSRSRSIGVVVPDITNPYFPAVVQAVEHELGEFELELALCDSANDVATEARRVDTLLRHRVDALLICPVDRERSGEALREAARTIPVVQLDREAVAAADYVGVDQRAGMALVVEHLRSAGASDAIFLGAHHGISSIAARAGAFAAACEAAGVTAHPAIELERPDIGAGRSAARALVLAGHLPSALVCANDQVAFGVLSELRARSIDCPREVMVTGYDDVPAAELLSLTSVRQPLRQLGREAVRLLRDGSEVPRRLELAPSLVARATTGGAS